MDEPDRHQMTLDLIEQVAAIRGHVRAMESEWEDMRSQIRKGYQRMEKANDRAERREVDEDETQEEPPGPSDAPPLKGFAAKLDKMKRGA